MSKERFHSFEEHLLAMRLPDNIRAPDGSALNPAGTETAAKKTSVRKNKSGDARWALFNPERTFNLLLQILKPLRLVFKGLVFALIPGAPISIYFIIWHSAEFQWTLRSLASEFGYFGHLLFTLFATNFFRCVIQGVLSAYYQAPVQEFGIRLRFGLIPRFYIQRNDGRLANRSAKLWICGSSLLLRLFLIEAGTLAWFLFANSWHSLGAFGVLLVHSGIIGLIIVSLPVQNSDGFRWLVNYFGWPPDMIRTAFDVFLSVIRRQRSPAQLSPAQVRRYFLYGLIIVMCWTLFAVKVTFSIAGGLEKTFPGIFGGATKVVFIGIVAALFLRWIAAKYMYSRFVIANGRLGSMLENEVQEASRGMGLLLPAGARQEEVAAAEANLQRADEQVKIARQERHVGPAYATVQNNTEPLVEVQLPEYQMEGVEVGAPATIKLYTYPDSPLEGKVLAIQPVILPTSTEQQTVSLVRMFQILIEVKKPPFPLKAGMTGYATVSAGL